MWCSGSGATLVKVGMGFIEMHNWKLGLRILHLIAHVILVESIASRVKKQFISPLCCIVGKGWGNQVFSWGPPQQDPKSGG